MSDHYFTFPLAVLNGVEPNSTPHRCVDLALNCGILGAGKGFRKQRDHEEFKERLEEICDKLELGKAARPGPCGPKGEVFVGASICNVSLGTHPTSLIDRIINDASQVSTGGPLVKMKADFAWAAWKQTRAENDPSEPWPDRGISWREFRILCAILSMKTNRSGFAFMGWETIQARAHGFTTKEAFKNRKVLPDHLAPPLTRKMIRSTCDALEDLGFYARFHFSSGKTGGLMAYSVRHSRDELAKAVCDSVNFRDRAKIKANREDDAKKCFELLERAKSGPRQGQQ